MGFTLESHKVLKPGEKPPYYRFCATKNTRFRSVQLFSKQFLRSTLSIWCKEKVGYAQRQSDRRGDDADPTDQDATPTEPLRATVLQARLAAGPGAARGHDPRSGKKNRDRGFAGHGLGEHQTLPALPPRPQPRRVVGPGGESRVAGIARGDVCAERPVGDRRGRNPGEALGQEDRRQGDLPRPRAL